ncbi:MAG: dihydroorotase [Chitinophagaceae bacterium]|nr:dihydroorotase [Chitinophagaceae bacterium]
MNIIQNSFQVVNTILPGITNEQITALFSGNARKLFSLNSSSIKEGEVAEITLFSKHGEQQVTKEILKSKSNNNPFTGKTLNGKVFGIINKGKLFLN